MWAVTDLHPSTVLVLTHWFDPTADWVVDELNKRKVPVFRCDAAEFPQRLTLTAELSAGRVTGTFRTEHRMVNLEEVSGIYYRRPTMFEFPESMSEPERRWATAEARLGFGGVLAAMRGWLNHPHDIARANYKPLQLRAAADAGLTTPRTLISNDPKAVRAFAEQVGYVAYKPMSSGGIQEEGQHKALYANKLSPNECDDLTIAQTAHMFQEWVTSDHAVRLTYVDGHFFAVAIHAHSEATRIDWRSDYAALSYEQVTPPEQIRRGVHTLMRTLGLRFGAFDFLVPPDEQWIFLEVNPNGQWAWIEEIAPAIAAAVADALTRKDITP
jgi:ATP-grasp ribosomal peptide maturase